MKCYYCGKEIADDSNFCEYCGHTINSNIKHRKVWKRILLGALVMMAILTGGIALVSIVEKQNLHKSAMDAYNSYYTKASTRNVRALHNAWHTVRWMDDIENWDLYFGERPSLELKKKLVQKVVALYNKTIDKQLATRNTKERRELKIQQDSIEHLMNDMWIHNELYNEHKQITQYEFLNETFIMK